MESSGSNLDKEGQLSKDEKQKESDLTSQGEKTVPEPIETQPPEIHKKHGELEEDNMQQNRYNEKGIAPETYRVSTEVKVITPKQAEGAVKKFVMTADTGAKEKRLMGKVWRRHDQTKPRSPTKAQVTPQKREMEILGEDVLQHPKKIKALNLGNVETEGYKERQTNKDGKKADSAKEQSRPAQ
ncbi:unnamed protein product [Linum trigynum]|uniref:Uncharacterized protein n=1 Tax=Linum trigynum TaxID=586398 RepID=A0AAV2DWY0_9ROSI